MCYRKINNFRVTSHPQVTSSLCSKPRNVPFSRFLSLTEWPPGWLMLQIRWSSLKLYTNPGKDLCPQFAFFSTFDTVIRLHFRIRSHPLTWFSLDLHVQTIYTGDPQDSGPGLFLNHKLRFDNFSWHQITNETQLPFFFFSSPKAPRSLRRCQADNYSWM